MNQRISKPWGEFAFQLCWLLVLCVGCNPTPSGVPASHNSSPGSATRNDATVLSAASGRKEAELTPPPPLVVLRERISDAMKSFVYRNGEEANHSSILESIGGGVAVLDYDNDGWLDLCFPGGGRFGSNNLILGMPAGFFRNLGGWEFAPVAQSALVESAHKESAQLYTHGASVGDYDNDGFADLLVTGYGGLQLWKNEGDGTFTEHGLGAGVQSSSWCTSAGWGDLTGDGNLDIYVCSYVNWSFENHPFCQGPTPQDREICPPREFGPLNDAVFYSNGDGTFRIASVESGLQAGGKGLGVVLCDVDNDGDLDVYVANDTTDNFLYLNEGGGRLSEVAGIAGAAVDHRGIPNGSMGVDACDFNRDGRLDLWVTNYEREPFGLYRNEGAGQFLHVSQSTGVAALGGKFVGFGTACFDLDSDGWEDLVVTNGHVIKYPPFAPRRQLPIVMLNESGHFRQLEFSANEYLSTPHEGRGLATGDFDRDGLQDFVISHLNTPPTLLANEPRRANRWLRLRLIGASSNRDAVGSRLVLHTSLGDQVRQIKGGGSYLSQGDYEVVWGIPNDSQLNGVTIHWPAGRVQTLTDVGPNTRRVVVEPNEYPHRRETTCENAMIR